jgi:hypothetical protein
VNTLDIARQGKSAARQIRAQMSAGVLTDAELDRLLKKVEAGFEQMIPAGQGTPPEARAAFTVIPGGGGA